jgi:hypothetical protein
MSCLGLDIGGANLKVADGRGWARTAPFAMWRNPGGLADAIANLICHAPTAEKLAVTMTGELCDCFRTKADGVRHILSAVEQAAAGRMICVYLVDGRLVSRGDASEQPHLAAASNWHALATFAGRYAHGRSALLVDIGSTTTLCHLSMAAHGRPHSPTPSGSYAASLSTPASAERPCALSLVLCRGVTNHARWRRRCSRPPPMRTCCSTTCPNNRTRTGQPTVGH